MRNDGSVMNPAAWQARVYVRCRTDIEVDGI